MQFEILDRGGRSEAFECNIGIDAIMHVPGFDYGYVIVKMSYWVLYQSHRAGPIRLYAMKGAQREICLGDDVNRQEFTSE